MRKFFTCSLPGEEAVWPTSRDASADLPSAVAAPAGWWNACSPAIAVACPSFGFAARSGPASALAICSPISGYLFASVTKLSRVNTRQAVSSTQMTWADRGLLSISDSSPKKSPGWSVATVVRTALVSMSTFTLPRSMKNNPSPGSPSLTMWWPDGYSSWTHPRSICPTTLGFRDSKKSILRMRSAAAATRFASQWTLLLHRPGGCVVLLDDTVVALGYLNNLVGGDLGEMLDDARNWPSHGQIIDFGCVAETKILPQRILRTVAIPQH